MLVLGYTFPFFSVPRAAQWNWDGSNNCYFLHRLFRPASRPEGGRIGDRQTCRGSISVTCTEQINSATNKGNGKKRKERERKIGKINKTDGRKILSTNRTTRQCSVPPCLSTHLSLPAGGRPLPSIQLPSFLPFAHRESASRSRAQLQWGNQDQV